MNWGSNPPTPPAIPTLVLRRWKITGRLAVVDGRVASSYGLFGAPRRGVEQVDDDDVDVGQPLDDAQPRARADHEVVGERQQAHRPRRRHRVEQGPQRPPTAHPASRDRPQPRHPRQRVHVHAPYPAPVQVQHNDLIHRTRHVTFSGILCPAYNKPDRPGIIQTSLKVHCGSRKPDHCYIFK